MWRNSALAALALLAGCDKLSSDGRSQRAGDVTVNEPTNEVEEVDAPEGVGAPMAWRVSGSVAAYGSAGQEPVLSLRCDRAGGVIIAERPGGGTAITLAANGFERTIAAEADEGGKVRAGITLDDELAARMAASQSQLMLVTAAGERLAIPGGVAVRRVLDTCRAPAVDPAALPYNGMDPANSVEPVQPPTIVQDPS